MLSGQGLLQDHLGCCPAVMMQTATVQALLDAGAIGGSPDVKLYSKLLVDVTGRADSCTELDPYDACFTAPGLLTIAKALVAAG